MTRKKITPAMRRHCDYLRRKAMATARIYGKRLAKLRSAQVKALLKKCSEIAPPEQWAGIIDTSFAEPYIRDIIPALYRETGLPQAKSTVRDMNKNKADESDILGLVWEAELDSYSRERAGELIVSVAGTVKSTLRGVLAERLLRDYSGVEQVVRDVYDVYTVQQEWEVRRIIQTETMMSLGKAGQVAADSLDIRYTKQWATSGLVNTRDTHLAVDGVTVDQDEPFRVGNSLLMYPHDTSLNAEAGEIINCACACIRMPI